MMIRTCTLALCLLLLLAGCSQNDHEETPAATQPQVTSFPRGTAITPPTPGVTRSALPTPTTTLESEPSPTAPSSYFGSPEYGVQVFMWWRPDIAERDLQLVKEMGFGWVKQAIPWREIETHEKGIFDWWKADFLVDATEAAGLELVVRLDRQPFWSQPEGTQPLDNIPPANLQDFGDFCWEIANRYRGRIAAYQVWNEPNLTREWGHQPPDPVEYTALLKMCYENIKVADPEAVVISAGLAPTGVTLPEAIPDTAYLQAMYDAGAAAYFDVLGVNAPGYAAPPEMSPEQGEATYGHRSFVFRRVEDARQIMVDNGDAHKQVAILEMGWTLDEVNEDRTWYAVDAETQADYLVRAYQYAKENWQPWIGLMNTIYIADFFWTEENEEYWWSIVLPDGTPRPAYFALQEMPK